MISDSQRLALHIWRQITLRIDYPCPATQTAIDELSKGLVDGRKTLIHNLFETKAGNSDTAWFVNWFMMMSDRQLNKRSTLFEAATGHNKDYWYEMLRSE